MSGFRIPWGQFRKQLDVTVNSTPEREAELAAPVVASLKAIESVFQRAGWFHRSDDPFDGPLVIDSRCRVLEARQAERRIVVRILFAAIAWDGKAPVDFSWSDKGVFTALGNPRAVLLAQAEFLVEYGLERETTFVGEQLVAFATQNGRFNAHPFWREFLLSASARTGLPQILAPILKL